MGYTIRTPGVRYTEWVAMTYANGIHTPVWTSPCARELYLYSGDNSTETTNVAEMADQSETVTRLRRRLHAGWRVAIGSQPWPSNLPDPTQTFLPNCGPAGLPPSPPTPPQPPSPSPRMCEGPVSECVVVKGNVNFNAMPEILDFPQVRHWCFFVMKCFMTVYFMMVYLEMKCVVNLAQLLH